MDVKEAREIVARRERFDFLDAADVSVNDLPDSEKLIAEAKIFLDGHRQATQEAEEALKESREEYGRLARALGDVNAEILRKDAELAHLRTLLAQKPI